MKYAEMDIEEIERWDRAAEERANDNQIFEDEDPKYPFDVEPEEG